MLIRNVLIASATGAIACLFFSSNVLANTCPTNLTQDEKGFWHSSEQPGWKSHIATPKDVTVDPKNFGGVVYSPKRQRLACVYRASNNKWIALVSDAHQGIKIDQNGKDDSGKAPAWVFSQKHSDYACGRPRVSDLSKCQFTFDDNSQTATPNAQDNSNGNSNDQNNGNGDDNGQNGDNGNDNDQNTTPAPDNR